MSYYHHASDGALWWLIGAFALSFLGNICMMDTGFYILTRPLAWFFGLIDALVSLWDRLQRGWSAFKGIEPGSIERVSTELPTPSDAVPVAVPHRGGWDRLIVRPDGATVWEMGDGSSDNDTGEVEHLREQIAALVRERLKLQAEALVGPAVARLSGRVVRIEVKAEGSSASVWLAVPDGDDRWQAIKVRTDHAALDVIVEGASVRITAVWEKGRLVLDGIETVESTEDPMPEVNLPDRMAGKVPDWFHSNAKNARKDLLKASGGSSSVSDLRVHLVWATKRRGKVLTAAMVDRLKTLTAEVVEAKGLGQLLAVNGEEDHCHLALHIHATVSGSDALGAIKAYTSRILRREFPELREHDGSALWQRGGYVGAIGHGGDLSAVLNYIANQDAPQALQEDQEAVFDDEEDQTDLSA